MPVAQQAKNLTPLAIALRRTILNIKDWNITILATDINPTVLRKAVMGIYGQWSFRNCPDWLKTGYFHDLGEGKYQVLPEIRDMVTFANLNLTDDVFPSLINNIYAMDIIFCRNVLMYFTDEWIHRISERFFKTLTNDSWFVVSSSELSSQFFPQFTPVNFQGAILYRKSNKKQPLSEKVLSPVVDKNKSFPVTPESLIISESTSDYSTLRSSIIFSNAITTVATNKEEPDAFRILNFLLFLLWKLKILLIRDI